MGVTNLPQFAAAGGRVTVAQTNQTAYAILNEPGGSFDFSGGTLTLTTASTVNGYVKRVTTGGALLNCNKADAVNGKYNAWEAE